VILLVHHRYRVPGGEERAVEDLLWLIPAELGEDVELLARDSDALGQARAAAGLLRGGLDPEEVAREVRRTGARVVHAHNLLPTFGWRALAAAKEAGARTVLNLHNYRLVCAVGTCFTHGERCTRCHGRDTRPGVRLNCRGSRAEAAVYATGLAAQQPHLLEHADVVLVPSAFALERLRSLGLPLGDETRVVPHPVAIATDRSNAAEGEFVLVASRLSPEKGVDVAIEACRRANVPLLIAGDGPERARLQSLAAGADVRFAGQVDPTELAGLRRRAALAVVPSRSEETFGLAALEAMAAGVPVVASRIGALPEAVPDDGLVPPDDVQALAEAVMHRYGDPAAGDAGLRRAHEVASPDRVAALLREVYDGPAGDDHSVDA
jgi:glycosyltransferase involved in cell wall biosynthesis